MEDPICPGCEKLVAVLDEAVAQEDPAKITQAVKEALVELISTDAITLPPEVKQPQPNSYARRLLHKNSHLDYTVMAMVWDVGQGTPLHDHDGLWCVEGVLEGRIEVTQYDLVEQSGALCRFRREETVEAGVGTAGRLIPPHDYHTIANALEDRPTITIHVYGGEMAHCSVFEPRMDGWYVLRSRDLALSA